MMSGYSEKTLGFALPAVMVISVLVMTIIAMAVSLVSLDDRIYQEYHDKKQRMLNIESALNTYCCDGSLFSRSDSASLDFDCGEIYIVRNDWGLYDCVTASDRQGQLVRRLYGRMSDSPEEAAFWICDRNRALTVGAGTKIAGTVCLPPNGVNYSGDISEVHCIPEAAMKLSLPDMPPLEDNWRERIMNLSDICSRNTFIEAEASHGDSVFTLNGMSLLHGDEIVISEKSVMHNAIICARKVIVRSGFKGCIQIFCSDSVKLEPGARLEWPSGICIISESGRPHVELCGGSSISGYVAVIGAGPDPELKFAGYEQHCDAVLNGLLYADCSCELNGSISGAAYVRDCYHTEDGIKFPGTIGDICIIRSDRIAFPILMKGEYARKAIKNMI